MDKELLFKDLSSRLPYGVKVAEFDEKGRKISNRYTLVWIENDYSVYGNLKPYLFPLSSMTKEQKEEIEDKLIFPSNSNGGWVEILYNDEYNIPFWFIDFCNKNHFDYRGLIEKGLAIDATGLNIYKEDVK